MQLRFIVACACVLVASADAASSLTVRLGAPLVLPPPQASSCPSSYSDWQPAPRAHRGFSSAASLVLYQANAADTRQYLARMHLCNGSSLSASWTVVVESADPLRHLSNSVLVLGSSLSISPPASSAGLRLVWLRNGQVLLALNNDSRGLLNVSAVTSLDAGSYLAVAANGFSAVAAVLAQEVLLAPCLPFLSEIALADQGVFADGSTAFVSANSVIDFRAVVEGSPLPETKWLVDSDWVTPWAASVFPGETLQLQFHIGAYSGVAINLTLTARNSVGAISRTIFVVAVNEPLLTRNLGAPLALVISSREVFNVSVNVNPGCAPIESYLWSWSGGSSMMTAAPWVLLGPSGDNRSGIVTCRAQSARAVSAPLNVLFLTATAPPVLTDAPLALVTTTSGATLRLTATATGAGNTFLWRWPGTFVSSGVVLKVESAPVSNAAVLEALPLLSSSVLVLSAVSIADASHGIELIVSNPAGTSVTAKTAITVLSPPWGLRCAPVVLLPHTRQEHGVTMTALIRAVLFVDSAACLSGSRAPASSSPECASIANLTWVAAIVGNSGCCPWSVNSSATDSIPLAVSDAAQVEIMLNLVECASPVDSSCYAGVLLSATLGGPFAVMDSTVSSTCLARSPNLPAPAPPVQGVMKNDSTATRALVQGSSTPYPGWVLFPVPHLSASSSLSATTSNTITSARSSTLAASFSNVALITPVASFKAAATTASTTVNSYTSSPTPSPSVNTQEYQTSDEFFMAAWIGLGVGAVLAASVEMLRSLRVRKSPTIRSITPSDAIDWIQFGILLDQLVIPEHFRFSEVSRAISWGSGIVVVLSPGRTTVINPIEGNGLVGMERFSSHLGLVSRDVPAQALAHLGLWCAGVAALMIALMLAGVTLLQTLVVQSGFPFHRKDSGVFAALPRASVTRVSLPAFLRACLGGQRFFALTLFPLMLSFGLHVTLWDDAGLVSMSCAVVSLAVCAALLLASLVVLRGRWSDCRWRYGWSETFLLLLTLVAPALIVGAWPPPAVRDQYWLQQCVALLVVIGVRCLFVAANTMSTNRTLVRSCNIVRFFGNMLQASIVCSLLADAPNLSSQQTGPLSANPGTFAAITLYCCCGSAAVVSALCWAMHVRIASIRAACFASRVSNTQESQRSETADVTRALQLNASFFGGRHIFDIKGALCFWALSLRLVLVVIAQPAKFRPSRAVVDVIPLPAVGSALNDSQRIQRHFSPRLLVVDPLDMCVDILPQPRALHDTLEDRSAPTPTMRPSVVHALPRCSVLAPVCSSSESFDNMYSEVINPHGTSTSVLLQVGGSVRGSIALVPRRMLHHAAIETSTHQELLSVASALQDTNRIGAVAVPVLKALVDASETVLRISYAPCKPRGFTSLKITSTARSVPTVAFSGCDDTGAIGSWTAEEAHESIPAVRTVAPPTAEAAVKNGPFVQIAARQGRFSLDSGDRDANPHSLSSGQRIVRQDDLPVYCSDSQACVLPAVVTRRRASEGTPIPDLVASKRRPPHYALRRIIS